LLHIQCKISWLGFSENFMRKATTGVE